MAAKHASATAKPTWTLLCVVNRALAEGSRGPFWDASVRPLKQLARRSGSSLDFPLQSGGSGTRVKRFPRSPYQLSSHNLDSLAGHPTGSGWHAIDGVRRDEIQIGARPAPIRPTSNREIGGLGAAEKSSAQVIEPRYQFDLSADADLGLNRFDLCANCPDRDVPLCRDRCRGPAFRKAHGDFGLRGSQSIHRR
jgi:hypothetical protein